MPVMNSLVSTNKVVVDPTLLAPSTPTIMSPPPTELSMGPPADPKPSVTPIASIGGVEEDTPMLPVGGSGSASTLPTPSSSASSSTSSMGPLGTPPYVPLAVTPAIALGNTVPVPSNIIPGPTYLEPMEEEDAAGKDGGATNGASTPALESKDIPMESSTNPPTPVSGIMQVESSESAVGGVSPNTVTRQLQKAESTTMLCEPSDGAGGNITNNPEVTTMLCDEVCTDIKELEDSRLTVKDILLLCQLFYLPADHGHVSYIGRPSCLIYE